MNKFITKHSPKLVALVAGFVLFSSAAEAQKLTVGATGSFNNEGTVRFRSNTGEFENNAPMANITNNGRIDILGTTQEFTGTVQLTANSAQRIPGLVSYRGTAGTQRIFNGYYDDVTLDAAALKSLTHAAGGNSLAYYVGGDYTILGGGDRTYTGSTFTYDGGTATTAVGTQTVAAENTTNGTGYNNLAFEQDALKTLGSGLATAGGTTNIAANTATGGFVVDGTAGGALEATGNFTQIAAAGDFSLNNGGLATINGPANAIGAIAAVNDGTLTLGAASVTDVTGALNLTSAVANTSNLALSGAGRLNVNGAYTNSDLGRTNTTFAATSTVEYQDGATNGIITTATANPYGNLLLNRTAADILANNSTGSENDLNIATSIQLAGGFDLNMLLAGGGTDGAVIIQNASAGDVVYAGQEEVIGRFRRTHALGASSYVFGNSATSVEFASAPTGGTFFEVNMDKDGQTQQYDNTRDVQRDVNLAYDNTAFNATVQVGYTQSDRTDATWNAGYDETQIRFLEGKADGSQIERVGTGNAYTRVTSGGATFGTVALPGITNGPDTDGVGDAGFFSSNELILRAGPGIVASVQPGRWSNPATWDAGEQPLAFDSVLVRHNVWAGFERTVDNFAGDELHPTELAAAINIISPDGTYPTPTLMIGYSDPDMLSNFETSTPDANGTGSVYTGAFGAATPNVPSLTNELLVADVATNYLAGLVIFNDPSDTEVPELWVKGNLVNEGAINIGGILSIGQ